MKISSSCLRTGVFANSIKEGSIIWGMLRTHALKDSRLKSGRFIELLVLKHSQSFTHNFALIGIAAGVHKTLHKL